MRRSNRNFNIPPPRANPGHLTTFCARGVGNLTGKAFPGVGNLTFAWVGWGKLNRKCQVFWAPKSLTAINTCLDEMEEFKGRDIAFVSDWLTKKVFKSCVVFLKVCLKSRECLNINDFYRLYINDLDFLYNDSSCGFVPQ